MSSKREEWIRELVERFLVIAELPEAKAHAGSFKFPRGLCTWASFALGHLLAEREPQAGWHIVNASGPSGIQGHDWLEDGDLAIDVTAHQFHGIQPYVGVAPPRCLLAIGGARGSNWGRGGRRTRRHWRRFGVSCRLTQRWVSGGLLK
ncbi:hypothetical protein QF036_003240 [Arthrobacter globiformis]|nr:hypothetical protein [Arthrobacter globiformis]